MVGDQVEFIKRMERPDPDEMRPLYEAIREATGGRRVVYFLLGAGGMDDFNRAILPLYEGEHDIRAAYPVVLDQPAQYLNGGEIRAVSTAKHNVLRDLKRYAKGIKQAILFDHSVRSGKSMMGGAFYCARGKLGDLLETVYVAVTRDFAGGSNFCRYPLYLPSENIGPREFMRLHAPQSADRLGKRLLQLHDEILFEGELPDNLPRINAHQEEQSSTPLDLRDVFQQPAPRLPSLHPLNDDGSIAKREKERSERVIRDAVKRSMKRRMGKTQTQ